MREGFEWYGSKKRDDRGLLSSGHWVWMGETGVHVPSAPLRAAHQHLKEYRKLERFLLTRGELRPTKRQRRERRGQR